MLEVFSPNSRAIRFVRFPHVCRNRLTAAHAYTTFLSRGITTEVRRPDAAFRRGQRARRTRTAVNGSALKNRPLSAGPEKMDAAIHVLRFYISYECNYYYMQMDWSRNARRDDIVAPMCRSADNSDTYIYIIYTYINSYVRPSGGKSLRAFVVKRSPPLVLARCTG